MAKKRSKNLGDAEIKQIAAIAQAHGLFLVTHNTREFSRVPGLLLENWQS